MLMHRGYILYPVYQYIQSNYDFLNDDMRLVNPKRPDHRNSLRYRLSNSLFPVLKRILYSIPVCTPSSRIPAQILPLWNLHPL